MPDSTQNPDPAGQTGQIPMMPEDKQRAESAKKEPPPRPPTAPEMSEGFGSTTGVMPAHREGADDTAERESSDAPV